MNRSDDLFSQPGGTPDPYWQRAFDDAFDTPPPRVWEGVERQLDLDESDGILPLWQHREGRQSMLFGRWAAGIAASLLLTALGWWAWHRENAIRPDVSVAVAPVHAAPVTPGTSLAPVGPAVAGSETKQARPLILPQLASTRNIARRQVRSGRANTAEEAIAATDMPSTSVPGASTPGTLPPAASGTSVPGASIPGALAIAEKTSDHADKAVVMAQPEKQAADVLPGRADEASHTVVFTETTMATTIRMNATEPRQSVGAGIQPSSMRRSFMAQSFSMQSVTVQSNSIQLPPDNSRPTTLASRPASEQSLLSVNGISSERLALSVDPLTHKQLVIRPLGNDRIVWYHHEQPIAEPTMTASKKRRERTWISAGVTASAFNPTVAVRSAFTPTASSYQSLNSSAAGATTSTLQNQIGRAVAFQAGIGIPFGEHWSVETGVGYLNGQNQIQSPARISSLASTVKSAATDNLYADLVGRLSNQLVYATNAGVAADKQQYDYTLANQASNYTSSQQQAVSNTYQFVQVPVQVGYELRPRRKFGLALLTGMVSNWFVKNTVADAITIKASDGVYRPVTLAGTAGMRLRYRPDNFWSASVAGTFQQSLQSLTRSDVSLQAQPQQVGVSFSVDRHF